MKARLATKTFAAVAVLICLVLAGVVSYYASGNPDGLNRVASDNGLSKQEKESAAKDSPLAGYDSKGVDNSRLSGGLAGVAGVLVVLGAAGGLAFVVRRRADGEQTPEQQD